MAKVAAKRAAVVLVALAVLALTIPPFVNVSRYKSRVTESLSRALGRPVTVGDISLRMLPQPGFDMENLVVGDDPAFSDEAILRADEVTAYLRLSSLWRGRLEVARLTLKYPSLNLVRKGDGHWNIESLLWKASRTNTAPTSARRPEARTRFPYIEAEQGRINFKYGLEKSSFALIEADFSLFSPAEDEWRTRLEARPVRTDLNISDTGTIKAEASFKRAAYLSDSPVQASLSWQRAQVGQITKLVAGEDLGWRGAIAASAKLNGTPAALHFVSSTSVEEFRRFDIFGGGPLALRSDCTGTLSSRDESLRDMSCKLPAGNGSVTVAGNVAGMNAAQYNLAFAIENLPANTIAEIARHTKPELADDLSASGTLNGAFEVKKVSAETGPVWSGKGEANGVTLTSAVLQQELPLGKIEFSVNADTPEQPVRHRGRHQQPKPSLPENALVIASFPVMLGGSAPTSVNGLLQSTGYNLGVKGEAELNRVLQVARTFGVSAPRIGLSGKANVDLQLSGEWMTSKADLAGSMQLRDARAEVPGLASPVLLSASHVNLGSNRMSFEIHSGLVGKTKFSGIANVPRSCDPENNCASTFNLQFDEIDPDQWNAALNPRMKSHPWYKLFGAKDERSVIATLNASGTVSAHRVLLGVGMPATEFGADFSIRDGQVELKNVKANLLGGTTRSSWTMAFNDSEPKYSGHVSQSRVNVAQLSAVANGNIGTGSLAGEYDVRMSGWTKDDLAKSVQAKGTLVWKKGVMKCFTVDGHNPLRVSNFALNFALNKGVLALDPGKLESPSGIYQVSGTIGNEHQLDLRFEAQKGATYTLKGSLQKPMVATAGRAEASLR